MHAVEVDERHLTRRAVQCIRMSNAPAMNAGGVGIERFSGFWAGQLGPPIR
jgi:hypothetical protein